MHRGGGEESYYTGSLEMDIATFQNFLLCLTSSRSENGGGTNQDTIQHFSTYYFVMDCMS